MTYFIKGKKINLRPLKISDAQGIYNNAKDKEIADFTNIPHPYKIEYAKQFIRKTRRELKTEKAIGLGIELNSNIIGIMSLINIDKKNNNAEVGYWLGKKYWGNGYSKEALLLIMKIAFSHFKFHRLSATVRSANISSAKLLEKVGFVHEGTVREAVLHKGKYLDRLYYGMLKKQLGK